MQANIAKNAFIANTATIVGDVTIGSQSSVWFGAVLRGDVFPIVIGNKTNIQDNCVLHGTYQKCGVILGNNITIGHSVILHGCEVKDTCLIGMGSILMDNVVINKNSIVGAGSLVTGGSQFDEGVLILGRPAKVVRDLNKKELDFLDKSKDNYIMYSSWYKQNKIERYRKEI